ncbi:MAG: hypothetical protein IPH11_01950 [Ignavibacteriales bacterium]|nr:hypothetical protein [Ignavibacteriales bacterium]
MLIGNTHRMLKVIVSVIFTVFIIIFLHSEFGLFDFDENNHSTHDYCYLVDNTTAQTLTQSTLPQLKVEGSFCFHCIQEIETNEILATTFEYKDFIYPLKNSDLYILNKVFLI